MQPILTAAEMRALEQEAIASERVTSLALQERAAQGAAGLIPGEGPVEVLAGPGNNGGDALALARILREEGRGVRVWALAAEPQWRGDAARQAERWRALGGGFEWTERPREVVAHWEGRWVVDGLFGLGASRPLEGLARAWVEAIQGHPVLALDQPSGWRPDDPEGGLGGATLTACFGPLKLAHLLEPARSAFGRIETIDLGLALPPERATHLRIEGPRVPQPAWNAHKGHRGHVAIRAGSLGMSGAAVMAAWGALRAGAGLVTLLPDAEVRAEVAAQVPEAMVRAWKGQVPEGVDVLLTGPGGIEEIPVWPGPLVLDASALREGEGPRWMARPDTLITPHPGEFARLFGLPRPAGGAERLAQARRVARGPGVLLLKGAQSLVVGGDSEQIWINDTGHWGLATGGTGDFLAGMVAGLRAQGIGPREAAATGAWLHGACADRLGKGPLMVRDLAAELPRLLREIHA